jgi:hypothetical protein
MTLAAPPPHPKKGQGGTTNTAPCCRWWLTLQLGKGSADGGQAAPADQEEIDFFGFPTVGN